MNYEVRRLYVADFSAATYLHEGSGQVLSIPKGWEPFGVTRTLLRGTDVWLRRKARTGEIRKKEKDE